LCGRRQIWLMLTADCVCYKFTCTRVLLTRSLFTTVMTHAEMAEPIKMPFVGRAVSYGPKNHVLHKCLDSPTKHGTWSHFVTQRPSDPGIQRPGDPVDPVTLFYNELQMSSYVADKRLQWARGLPVLSLSGVCTLLESKILKIIY